MYGVVWILVFLFIDLCIGLLIGMGVPDTLAGTLQVPVTIIAGGVLYCSFYPAYTSVFGVNDAHAGLDNSDSAHA